MALMANMTNVEKKEKYELIIALIAIVISLSAFKDELKTIEIDLGFYILSLANYFLLLILTFIFALHLYAFPIFLGSTFLSKFKIFRIIEMSAYFLFSFAIISPTLIIIIYLINVVIIAFTNYPLETLRAIKSVMIVISFALTSIFTAYQGYVYYIRKKEEVLQQIEEKKINGLELAQRLFIDGYYSQSILESIKVIENYFKSILIDKNDISYRTSNNDILKLAEKNELLDEQQMGSLKRVMEMRNSAAHLNNEFNKEEAEFAITTAKKLLMQLYT